MVATFVFFMALFLLVGLAANLTKKDSLDDFLLAGRSVHPVWVALSAVSTCNSGFMFIGMIGFTYTFGISSIWPVLGTVVGDFCISLMVYKRFREASESQNAMTYAQAISFFQGRDYLKVRKAAALLITFFLTLYAAAQFVSQGKALFIYFDYPYYLGAIIGALSVFAYCFSSGVRASIWTDCIQSVVMMASMIIAVFWVTGQLGGWESFWSMVQNVSPSYTNIFPENLSLGPFTGPLLFVMGWFFAGILTAGQPHIMVRYMTSRSPQDMPKIRLLFSGWFLIFSILVIILGLAARLLLGGSDIAADPELALPMLALNHMPGVLAGIILAGLFAAALSTADSQILSSSSALSEDLLPNWMKDNPLKKGKLLTATITFFALGIALLNVGSVFSAVWLAWSGLGATLGPLMILRSLKKDVKESTALVMMGTAISVVIMWKLFDLENIMNEGLPGFAAAFLIYFIDKAFSAAKHTQSKCNDSAV